MVIHYHSLECWKEKLVCFLQGQGENEVKIWLIQSETEWGPGEWTHKGVNERSKDITQTQQLPESPKETLTRHARVHVIVFIELIVFTCMPGENYHRHLRSLLLCLCDIFWVLMNSLVCWFWKYMSIISSELLLLLQPILVWWYIILRKSVV